MSDFATLLKSARIMRGYSLQDLADRLMNRITKQSLSKYEKNMMKPTLETFTLLCDALDVGPDYFDRDSIAVADNLTLRKMDTLGAKERERLKQHVAQAAQRYMELEALMEATIPFKNPLKAAVVKTTGDAEDAAGRLREKWFLGHGPIKNVLDLIEHHGVKTIEWEDDRGLRSTSGWLSDKHPVIVLASSDASREEKRLNALRELGHLMLSFPAKFGDKQREVLCERFASALLMPADDLLERLGEKREHFLAAELFVLKTLFGAPIRSIVGRASDLGIVTEHFFRRHRLHPSPEPAAYKKQNHVVASEETSSRFRLLLYRAVADEIISTSRAAELADMRVADLRDELAQRHS